MPGRYASRIRLTSYEIEAILAVSGDTLPEETLSSGVLKEAVVERSLAAFCSGMDKLREMLARSPVPDDD